jgi:hypothetical protein
VITPPLVKPATFTVIFPKTGNFKLARNSGNPKLVQAEDDNPQPVVAPEETSDEPDGRLPANQEFSACPEEVLPNTGCGSLHKSYQSDIPKIIRLRVNFRFYFTERINGVLSFGRNVLTFTGEGTFLGLKSVNLLGSPLPSGTFSTMTNYDFSGHGAKYATDTVHRLLERKFTRTGDQRCLADVYE